VRSFLRPTLTASNATTRGPLTDEVVKLAIRADLDGVALNWFSTTFKLQQFRPGERTGAACGKTGAKHVGDFNEFTFLTHGARFTGGATNVVGGTEEFGVGITDVFTTERTGFNLRQEGVTN
jgi:hypothetical protein